MKRKNDERLTRRLTKHGFFHSVCIAYCKNTETIDDVQADVDRSDQIDRDDREQ